MTENAILVVSFGTSYQETREKTLDALQRRVVEEFPDWEVRRAFTSKMIIRILRKRDNLKVDYVTEAMQRLVDDGFRNVVVLPTHVINGIEYDDIRLIVDGFRNRFNTIRIGSALLSYGDDYAKAIEGVKKVYMDRFFGDEPEGKAMVLMGHGSDHFANACYSELQMRFHKSGYDDIYITTVEGFPSLDYTIEKIAEKDYRRICLVPFMVVAGDHAVNDMAGYEDDSLRSRFFKLGYEVECIIEGLLEHKEFQDIYIDHLKRMTSQ